MIVYVDTNILIDFVCARTEFVDSAQKLFTLGYMGKVRLQTSALSYITAMYVANKYKYQNVKASLLAVSRFVEVLDLQAKTGISPLQRKVLTY